MNSASLCSLAGRYNNTIPPRFLTPIDSSKIPALAGRYVNPIPTRFVAPIDCLKIPAQLLETFPQNRGAKVRSAARVLICWCAAYIEVRKRDMGKEPRQTDEKENDDKGERKQK